MKNFTPHFYKIMLRDISEGQGEAFEAYVPAFDSHNFGDTIEDALKAYYKYFASELKHRKKDGIEMPKPDAFEERMKQVPLRLPESIYEKNVQKAKEQGKSFNAFVTAVLS